MDPILTDASLSDFFPRLRWESGSSERGGNGSATYEQWKVHIHYEPQRIRVWAGGLFLSSRELLAEPPEMIFEVPQTVSLFAKLREVITAVENAYGPEVKTLDDLIALLEQ